ncbi:MAG: PrsW family intramembrane metalloprotease [Chthoniobacterales bacterium]
MPPPPLPATPAGSPPPLSAVRGAIAVPSRALRGWLIAAAILAALSLGLVMLILLGLSTGFVGLIGGIILATLPVPFYMLLALWIDRFEKEPVWMLIGAFVWGATVAVFVAFVFNTIFEAIAYNAIAEMAGVATATLSAPVIEELGKGLALVIFYFWKRDEFDNVIDGIIYAAMVGLGFAMTENILYYGRAIAEGGLGGSVFVFFLRGVVSPFAHPFFTSMTGIGLGLAQQSRQGSPLKIIAPLIGLMVAMALHGLWNLSAAFGAVFLVAYVVVMVPAFGGVLLLIGFSLRSEGRIIRQHLATERESGFLDPAAFEALCTVRGRFGDTCSAWRSGGFASLRARRQFHAFASELAFHRWRTSRGILPRIGTAAEREAAVLQRLHTLKSRLR